MANIEGGADDSDDSLFIQKIEMQNQTNSTSMDPCFGNLNQINNIPKIGVYAYDPVDEKHKDKKNEDKYFIYFVAYRVLLHLLLLYCVFGITYLLFANDKAYVHDLITNTMDPTNEPSVIPSFYPTNQPSISPSLYPMNDPNVKPTLQPSSNPSLYPAKNPSMMQTTEPTYFAGNSIGDIKFSFKNSSHGFWKKCNGEYLLIDGTYTSLYEEIGFEFGQHFNDITGEVYFQSPFGNVEFASGMIAYFEVNCPYGWVPYNESNGRYILTAGYYTDVAEDGRTETQTYLIGSKGGEIKHTQTVSEMASHNHIVSGQDNLASPSGGASIEVANVENYPSYFFRKTSSTGGNTAHNNMPPYLVLNACQKIDTFSNLFVYTA